MYVQLPNRGYNRDGQQWCRKAPFLLLLQTSADDAIYGVVRNVALKQLGHWMMGKARILGHSYSVSGAYGGDGLPMTVEKIPPDARKLPDELHEAWSRGGGWNNVGSEASAMVEWARKELLNG